jgi:hypothetical protein
VVAPYGVGRAVAIILPLGAAGRPPPGYTPIPGRQPSLAACPVRGCGTSLFERTPERSANHADRDGDLERMARRGIEWYSATADDPEMCRAKWADKPRRAHLLRTGRLFGVVVISRRIGLETFGQLVCHINWFQFNH